MSILNLQESFVWLVERYLGITAIKSDQFKTRPERYPYAVIRVGTINKIGSFDRIGDVDAEGNRKIIGDRQATVTVDIIGEGANEAILKIMSLTDAPTVLKRLYTDYEVSIQGILNYQNLSNVLETEGQERAVIDYLAGFAYVIEEEAGWIEKVQVNGNDIPE